MESSKSVQAYFEKHPKWAVGLAQLHDLMLQAGLQETIKWGAPAYTYEESNLIGIAAFKEHFALWFHQGVFLSDPHKLLINAQEGTTKALRQLRFDSVNDINPEFVLEYVLEAISNQRAGKRVKIERSKTYDMPEILEARLSLTPSVHESFNALTFGKQKEFANYISEAKQESTRLKRVEKIIPMIAAGIGLHDKYR